MNMNTQIHWEKDGVPTVVSRENALPVQFGRDDTSFSSTPIVTNVANVSDVLVKQGTAGASIYITDILISSSAVTVARLIDSDGTAVAGPFYLAANSSVSVSLITPIAVTAAKNLMVRASTSTNLSVAVNGYVI